MLIRISLIPSLNKCMKNFSFVSLIYLVNSTLERNLEEGRCKENQAAMSLANKEKLYVELLEAYHV
jgi:hypothetical protein